MRRGTEALQTEVKAFHELRDKLVQDLAVRFGKKENDIRVFA
jgi:hypothetical protein